GPAATPTSSPGASGPLDPSPSSTVGPVVGGVVGGGDPPVTPGGPGVLPGGSFSYEPGVGPIAFGTFGEFGPSIEWMVPTLAFTLPGFLLILIALAQGFGGIVWLPLVRRWLRGDGRPAPNRRSAVPNRG
ncbi:MAG: hypothetical protein QOI37_1030, partial [Chloroflexota bacterium]|nr:hypothetical protein [Chloroflexota bacterium]